MNYTPISANEITELTTGLHQMAKNLWWTWNQDAQEVFHTLSPRGWQNLYHNAVAVLHEVSDYELRVRLQEPEFTHKVRSALQQFNDYLNDQDTWGAKNAPWLKKNPVAYFSAEFGLHESLPIAAGGLGVLAGDHTKAASDLDLGFCGISLFYREGYFQQAINHENWQTEYYTRLNPNNLSMEPVLNAKGEQLVGSVEIANKVVYFQAWQVKVGRVTLYLIDANRPENEQQNKDLTLRVYGGDESTRIRQEILLGIGGVRLMRALGITPSVFHMNEGHAAFLSLELMREQIAGGKSLESAMEWTRERCVFTTHTPVEAGHDRFAEDLMHYAFSKFCDISKIKHKSLMPLGRIRPNDADEPFCMTVLALKTSRAANGVSELHGQVSREMWKELYPEKSVEEVPIGHITNGIYLKGWMKGPVRKFWKRKVGDSWEQEIARPEFWHKMDDAEFISDEEIWAMRYHLRRELIEFARRKLLIQGQRITQSDFIAYDRLLNPDALTIGFARRFATYKRAPLIFERMEEIVSLCKDPSHPVQFVFAGKAHPRDDDGKRFIQKIIHLSLHSELNGNLVFLENYDIHVARMMVSGCDVWLNNPRRPLEASGTSGQKVTCHFGLNLSILDGWWREGYNGENGFAIGNDSHAATIEEQDRVDSENLYNALKNDVIPCFFARDAEGVPRQWIKKIRHAMKTLIAEFGTWRMVEDYARKMYSPGNPDKPENS